MTLIKKNAAPVMNFSDTETENLLPHQQTALLSILEKHNRIESTISDDSASSPLEPSDSESGFSDIDVLPIHEAKSVRSASRTNPDLEVIKNTSIADLVEANGIINGAVERNDDIQPSATKMRFYENEIRSLKNQIELEKELALKQDRELSRLRLTIDAKQQAAGSTTLQAANGKSAPLIYQEFDDFKRKKNDQIEHLQSQIKLSLSKETRIANLEIDNKTMSDAIHFLNERNAELERMIQDVQVCGKITNSPLVTNLPGAQAQHKLDPALQMKPGILKGNKGYVHQVRRSILLPQQMKETSHKRTPSNGSVSNLLQRAESYDVKRNSKVDNFILLKDSDDKNLEVVNVESKLKATIAQLEAENKDINGLLLEKDQQIGSLKRELIAKKLLDIDPKSSESELANAKLSHTSLLEENAVKLNATLSGNLKEIADLKAKTAIVQYDLESCIKQRDSFQTSCSELSTKVDVLLTDLNAARQNKDTVTIEVSNLKEALAVAMTKCEEQNIALSKCELLRSASVNAEIQLQSIIKSLNENVKALQLEIVQHVADAESVDKYKFENQRLLEQVEKQELLISGIQESLTLPSSELLILQRENGLLKDRLVSLEAQLSHMKETELNFLQVNCDLQNQVLQLQEKDAANATIDLLDIPMNPLSNIKKMLLGSSDLSSQESLSSEIEGKIEDMLHHAKLNSSAKETLEARVNVLEANETKYTLDSQSFVEEITQKSTRIAELEDQISEISTLNAGLVNQPPN
jgi:hypothetical protein